MLTVQQTGDGSLTLFSSRFQETYHSRHGAMTESLHVFIENGLLFAEPDLKEIHIGEIGLGTGLNAMLSLAEGARLGKIIRYAAVEIFPLSEPIIRQVVSAFPGLPSDTYLNLLHAPPEEKIHLSPEFEFIWHRKNWPEENPFSELNLLYYDAFAPGSQPELWTSEAFEQAFRSLKPGGILVTYCANGEVKRKMKAAGFEVFRLPGPPGKREMTRAKKPF